MRPNFALSLSMEGIRLLHRVPGGWHLVGEVALEGPDLSGRLARLRDMARALDPSGLRCKLLLPNDQIKYLAIDTTRTTLDDIHAALDGTTPYALDQLAIDFDRTGGRTHIAAVARETLAEAEAFASQHDLNPICFAAIAEPLTFSTEVFFGPTRAAMAKLGSDDTITRDDHPVTVIGQARMPILPDLEAETAAPPVTRAPQKPPQSTVVAEQDPPAPRAAPTPPVVEPVLSFSRARQATGATVTGAGQDAGDEIGAGPGASAPHQPEAATQASAPPVQPTLSHSAQPTALSPINGDPKARKVGGPAEQSPNPSPATPVPAAPPPHATPAPSPSPPAEPVFTSRAGLPRTPAPSAPPPVPQQPAHDEPLFTRRTAAPQVGGVMDGTSLRVAEPDAPAVPRPLIASDDLAGTTPETSAGRASAPAVASAPVRRTTVAPKNKQDSSGFLSRRRARKPKATPSPADVAVLGSRTRNQVRGKPRYLGLMLTAGLLLFLALVALWASSLDEEGLAGLFGNGAETSAPTVASANPTSLGDSPAQGNPSDATGQTRSAAPATVAVQPLAPASGSDLAPAIQQTPAPSALTEGGGTADPGAETPPVPIVTTVPGRVLSPAEANRIYAATGVWQRAPRLMEVPGEQTTEGLIGFDTLSVVAPLTEPPALVLSGVAPDQALIPPLNPLPAGVILPRDADGFILASPEGTVMPNGVLVFAKAPDVIPPYRPGSEPVAIVAPIPRPATLEVTATGIDPDAATQVTDAAEASAPTEALPDIAATVSDTAAPPLTAAEIAAAAVAAALSQSGTEVVAGAAQGAPLIAASPDATPQGATPDPDPTTQAPDAGAAAAVTDADAPEGLILISGRPEVVPPLRPFGPQDISPAPESPDTSQIVATADPPTDAAPLPRAPGFEAYAEARPLPRPDDRVPTILLPPPGDPALAGFRPAPRPEGLAPDLPAPDVAEAAVAEALSNPAQAASTTDINSVIATIAAAAPPSLIISPTQQAIVASPRPDTRPRNFATVVARAQQTSAQENRQAALQTSANVIATPQPATTAPAGRVPGSVAAAATQEGAIGLRNINLIGVYGRPNQRRALIRMANGRYVRVEVGSSFEGGRITAIGDNALNYVVGGRTYSLQIPQG